MSLLSLEHILMPVLVRNKSRFTRGLYKYILKETLDFTRTVSFSHQQNDVSESVVDFPASRQMSQTLVCLFSLILEYATRYIGSH